MRYYLDTEFDGHSGPLLSLAMVNEEGLGLHLRTGIRAMDLWVIQNVEPLMDKHDADVSGTLDKPNDMGRAIRDFIDLSSLVGDDEHTIIADAPGDIARFCAALGTGEEGGWTPTAFPRMNFEYHNLEPYPTTLPGAVQHNAWWDAMALREKLSTSTASPARPSTFVWRNNNNQPDHLLIGEGTGSSSSPIDQLSHTAPIGERP